MFRLNTPKVGFQPGTWPGSPVGILAGIQKGSQRETSHFRGLHFEKHSCFGVLAQRGVGASSEPLPGLQSVRKPGAVVMEAWASHVS